MARMADRYYSDKPILGTDITLTGNEAHHLLHVMRAEPGVKIVLFDGLGGQHDAEVLRCDRKTVELTVGPRREDPPELAYPLTLAVALPKGDRQRWLVEKAVELGVTRLVPLETQHSVSGKAHVSSKLSRYVIEACKQCGRNQLLEIAPPQEVGSFLEQADVSHRRLFAHPGGASLSECLQPVDAPTSLVIGPEGGFADEEVAFAADRKWQIVDLGSRLLRVETAALVLTTAVLYR